MLIFDCERFKMGEKNKRLLTLWTSFIKHTQIALFLTDQTNDLTQLRQQHTGLPAQSEQTQPDKHPITKSSLTLSTGRVWIDVSYLC